VRYGDNLVSGSAFCFASVPLCCNFLFFGKSLWVSDLLARVVEWQVQFLQRQTYKEFVSPKFLDSLSHLLNGKFSRRWFAWWALEGRGTDWKKRVGATELKPCICVGTIFCVYIVRCLFCMVYWQGCGWLMWEILLNFCFLLLSSSYFLHGGEDM